MSNINHGIKRQYQLHAVNFLTRNSFGYFTYLWNQFEAPFTFSLITIPPNPSVWNHTTSFVNCKRSLYLDCTCVRLCIEGRFEYDTLFRNNNNNNNNQSSLSWVMWVDCTREWLCEQTSFFGIVEVVAWSYSQNPSQLSQFHFSEASERRQGDTVSDDEWLPTRTITTLRSKLVS